jgi:hypothetical protein
MAKWLGNASCNNLESKTQRLPIKYRAYQSCHHFALITRSIDLILYALSGSRTQLPAPSPLRTVHGSFDPHGSSLY